MEISVLIPFRAEDQRRQQIFDWIVQRYRRLIPEADICIGTDNSEIFNRSRARNNAFKMAKYDTILVADADTIFSREQIQAGFELIKSRHAWVLPYGWYYNLTEPYSDFILTKPSDIPIPAPSDSRLWEHRIESWAGLVMLNKKAYKTVNGYDERFIGWGMDDNAFRIALDTLVGPYERVARHGAMHLWHPYGEYDGFNSPKFEYNRSTVFEKYRRASGNRDKMKEVVRHNG